MRCHRKWWICISAYSHRSQVQPSINRIQSTGCMQIAMSIFILISVSVFEYLFSNEYNIIHKPMYYVFFPFKECIKNGFIFRMYHLAKSCIRCTILLHLIEVISSTKWIFSLKYTECHDKLNIKLQYFFCSLHSFQNEKKKKKRGNSKIIYVVVSMTAVGLVFCA